MTSDFHFSPPGAAALGSATLGAVLTGMGNDDLDWAPASRQACPGF